MNFEGLSLEERIRLQYSTFSKKRKKIADFILRNIDIIAFSKSEKLVERLGVSESTLSRFAYSVGYNGFSDLRKNIQNKLQSDLDVYKVHLNSKRISEESSSSKMVMRRDISNIESSMKKLDVETLKTCAKLTADADAVYVLGSRTSSVLSTYLSFYLNYMIKNLRILSPTMDNLLDDLIHIGKKDVLLSFSFPRYSNKTYRAIRHAKEKGAKIIGFTDGPKSPMLKYTKHLIYADFHMSTFIDSMCAPISVCNAFLVELASINDDVLAKNFTLLERMWNEYDVYERE